MKMTGTKRSGGYTNEEEIDLTKHWRLIANSKECGFELDLTQLPPDITSIKIVQAPMNGMFKR